MDIVKCVFGTPLPTITPLHIFQELLDITVEAPSTEEHSSDGDNSTDGIGTIKAFNGTANLLPVLQNPSNGTTLRETKRPIHLKIPEEEVLSVLELGASWAAVSVQFCSLHDVHSV